MPAKAAQFFWTWLAWLLCTYCAQERGLGMARMEKFEPAIKVSTDFAEDKDIQLWLMMGRMAFFFCMWSAMILPIVLVIMFRF
jgi:hypothetical protein